MNTIVTRSILAAACVAIMPLAAGAAQTPPSAIAVVATPDATLAGPVRLNNVTIQPSAGWQNNFAYSGLTVIAFTNLNASPAIDIIFTLRGGLGQVIGTIEDVGNYAQGQTVRHTFVNNEIDPNQSLDVERATFADGSTWTNPGPLAPSSRRQAH